MALSDLYDHNGTATSSRYPQIVLRLIVSSLLSFICHVI